MHIILIKQTLKALINKLCNHNVTTHLTSKNQLHINSYNGLAYKVIRGTAPLILNPGARGR